MKPMQILMLTLILTASALAADPFAEYVRSTDPKSPPDEQKTFHLPPGFKIELIASEPQIGKPMNLAFDSRGRLWVTTTHEYPFPAKSEAEKKDRIQVIDLADNSVSTFADHLDIPIGVYPITDGSSVIAYDVNNVCRYSDSDGDGKSDKREVLYPGWGYQRDTHGMSNNYRRGFDGWLYGCHGFNNISDVKGSDGQVMHLRSGNTYRMRLDGSHIEAFTIGQINPFGMSQDPLGNLYTSDSHSKPIYQLLRGGRYEAFDRNTDDGLGLAPMMMTHLHGSTAIAGSCFYAADAFPEEFRGDVFTGNVVTCRINRDKLEYHGSSPQAIEQPDFLSTDDPWFRPVNTILGPDGALYVADFYNRIIAHYEVKLDDPRRDYERGRIWRISFSDSRGRKSAGFDISKSNPKELIEKLNDPNLTVRMLAMNELSDRIGEASTQLLIDLFMNGHPSSLQKIHGLWVLHRLKSEWGRLLLDLASDPDPSVRVHLIRVCAETDPWTEALHRRSVIAALNDTDALVRRCAADALGQHPELKNVKSLLEALAHADRDDTHLVYTLRMALRNQFRADGVYANLDDLSLSPEQIQAIAQVSVAVESPDAAAFLLDHIEALSADKAALTRYLRHAVRFANSPNIDPLARLMREKFADDLDLQLELYDSVRQGLEQRGRALTGVAQQWIQDLVTRVLAQQSDTAGWTSAPLDPTAAVVTPWAYEERQCSGSHHKLLSSLPGGEQTTAVLRSKPFALPAKLQFFLAGHNGFPGTTPTALNVARLRDADSNDILAEAPVPRDDKGHKITWKLDKYRDRQAYMEITDADAGNAYAWLAFGVFNPPVVEMPKVGLRTMQQRLQQAAKSAGEMKLTPAASDLRRVLLDRGNDTDTRTAAANALAAMKCDDASEPMQQIVASPDEVMPLRTKTAAALGAMGAQQAIIDSFKTAPAELQTALATALASNTRSAESLLDAVANGKAPPRVLLDAGIHDRLAAANVPDLDKRLKQLTRGVFAPKQQIEKLIIERRAAFRAAAHPDPAAGQKVFEKNCVACHEIDGKGGKVGPNLAGLGKRGIDRLAEDVLDPNRNVDPAFHFSNIILKDGHLISGLQKKQEGEVLFFADQTGKEVQVKQGDIQQRIETRDSLMPSNFGEIIGPEEFNNLMAYLISK